MVPVLTSFLPPAHAHLYLPACFTIWSSFNLSLLDDRFIEMCGDLSEEHVSAPLPSEGGWWNGLEGCWYLVPPTVEYPGREGAFIDG